jgi:PAS domain S-box-containing protein
MQEQGARSEQIPVQVVHRDGYSFPVNLRLSIVPDATGQTMFTVHFFTPAADANGISAGMEMRRTRTDTSVLLSTDTHGRITVWSPEAQERFGFEESEVLGRGLHTLFRPSDATDFYAELLAIRETSKEPTKVVEWTFFHKTEGRQTGPFIIQLDGGTDLSVVLLEELTVLAPPAAPESAPEPVTQPAAPEQSTGIASSPTPLKPSGEELKRERLLLGETHHRVKNHLQIITSMLNLQMSTLHQEDAREALRSSQNRVRSIAALHQHLFQLVTGDAADFRAFAEGLISHLRECYQVDESRVSLQLNLPDQPVPEEWLMPLALALNEMVSNAFKHAFPDGQKGSMRVEFAWDNAQAELTVVDDGIGMPTGPAQHDSTGLGLKILRVFAGQLGGEIRTHSAPGQGTVFQLRFPSTAELGAA